MGLTKPSYGSIQVLGYDVRASPMEIQENCWLRPEAPRLYEFLTATDNLDFIAMFEGYRTNRKRSGSPIVDALDLEGKQGDMISSYSQA